MPKSAPKKKSQKKKKKAPLIPAIPKKAAKPAAAEESVPKEFLDIIAPGAARFNTDHYILGNSYRTVFALRGYPTSTEELALLRHLGEKSGVTLSIYARKVDPAEERKILHNAANKNRMSQASTNDLKQTITAEANLQDVANLIASMHKNREPLMHCAVFIELAARDQEGLRSLQNEVLAELVRSKLSADRVLLRQQEGFRSVNPMGWNAFGSQYERVLPASSVANLYPFNYSGKTDPHGFYIGKDRYGSNIIVDLDRRAEDKTNGSVLILGNSGEGKSYLLKLLLENCLEAGKTVISLDPEHELVDLSRNLGGCFIDLMSGRYLINPLEPKVWDVDGDDDAEAPAAFRQHTRLSQHIAFLKRVRKKESSLIMASQNLEDFDVDGIRELTRPLFAIPTHQFIFHCGAVDKQFYMNNLQLEQSEYELIRYSQNGVCLYKCGVERFLLEVHAPEYKAALFGKAGGR